MTELEKMLSGKMYNGTDPQLTAMRTKARKLLTEINAALLDTTVDPAKAALYAELFGAMGKDGWLQPPFFCDYGTNIFMGDKVFINFNCVFLDCARITIGSNVFMAPNVQLYCAGHPLVAEQRARGEEFALPITIEDDVWIGGGVIVCPGVTIGAKSVVGAGAVVTKNVPPASLAAGNPARVLKAVT
ncbi:MAG TPA: sugar O-acetyltransferase [Verrucomicrobiae bacterium]|nr:sugar O-acetyltransferase [Verrucomicrobiae bacterium]